MVIPLRTYWLRQRFGPSRAYWRAMQFNTHRELLDKIERGLN